MRTPAWESKLLDVNSLKFPHPDSLGRRVPAPNVRVPIPETWLSLAVPIASCRSEGALIQHVFKSTHFETFCSKLEKCSAGAGEFFIGIIYLSISLSLSLSNHLSVYYLSIVLSIFLSAHDYCMFCARYSSPASKRCQQHPPKSANAPHQPLKRS